MKGRRVSEVSEQVGCGSNKVRLRGKTFAMMFSGKKTKTQALNIEQYFSHVFPIPPCTPLSLFKKFSHVNAILFYIVHSPADTRKKNNIRFYLKLYVVESDGSFKVSEI